METTLRYDREVLEQLCRERHVKRLDLFGSWAKGAADGESDVDLLVEFEPGHTPGLLGFIEFEEELAALFGEKVDLVSSGGPYTVRTDDTPRLRFSAMVGEESEVEVALV